MVVQCVPCDARVRWLWVAALGAFLLSGAVLAILHYYGYQTCLLQSWCHLPCWTCGTTRALMALGSGKPWQALCLQPMMMTLLVAIGGLLVVNGWYIWTRNRVLKLVCTRVEKYWLSALALVAVLLNWLYLILQMK